MAACLLLCSCGGNEDEPQLERKISVTTYESIMPKSDSSYKPKEWSYSNTMLFSCNVNDIDKAASTASLANGAVTLSDGSTLAASYKSDTGVLYDVAYGNYALVVYCTGNPTNAYLEHRWSAKQLNYTESNSITSLTCCFVWEDMHVGGGWSAWQDK